MRTSRFAALVFLALAPCLLASSVDQHVAKARQAEHAGDLAVADREYQAALAELKKRPEAMRVFLVFEGLANVAERRHDLAAAEQYLQQALEARHYARTGPAAELPALLDLKRFYAAQKRWEDGARTADRIVSIWRECGAGAQPGTAQYLGAAGDMYRSAGDNTQAEERYRAALAILEASTGPESAAWAHAAGRLAATLAENRPEEAEALFVRAVAVMRKTLGPGLGFDMIGSDYPNFLRKHGREADAAEFQKSRSTGSSLGTGPGVTAPHAISTREPEYTDRARSARMVGLVFLFVEVDESGKVANAQVIEPLGFGLDEKAIEAAEAWKFRPATQAGRPVRRGLMLEMHFRLL